MLGRLEIARYRWLLVAALVLSTACGGSSERAAHPESETQTQQARGDTVAPPGQRRANLAAFCATLCTQYRDELESAPSAKEGLRGAEDCRPQELHEIRRRLDHDEPREADLLHRLGDCYVQAMLESEERADAIEPRLQAARDQERAELIAIGEEIVATCRCDEQGNES